MISKPQNIKEYLDTISADRIDSFLKLRNTILANLPKGFVEELSYGMIGYVVPHSLYPKGYHCNTKLPLPLVNIASQKNFIALYHMGIYASPKLLDWFVSEFPKHCKSKLDMGKSCIRFKKTDEIPYDLIGQLMQKISVEDWINLYEINFVNSKAKTGK
ncbi:MAG: DUF1801 domain-containing protein [Bacteroidia bacterium]|nr:DUF1801 domain-containing protein [Bacteroidia bacterium]